VFYDRMQVGLGSAQLADCALSVLVSVISRPTAERIVVDGGSKTFALDRGAHGNEALQGYGYDGARDLQLERLSEEHGIAAFPMDGRAEVCVGDRLRFVPNHACTTANLASVLVGVRNSQVEEVFPVLVRGGGH
jgi:D-serine deaminase-like pyridoxal phosphate-dependent protein